MTVIDAIIEGIIQGATEFLPVSSSGHLSLSQHFLGISVPSLFFDVMLHLGTLIAVIAVYYKLVWRLLREFVFTIRDIFTGRFKWSEMNQDRRLMIMLIIGLLPLFLLFLPVPGTEYKIKDFADMWATDSDILVEGFSLIATSILLTVGIVSSHKTAQRHARRSGRRPCAGRKQYNAVDAVFVGLFQCAAAVFPGLSRSGSTLSAGLMRGINRKTALDYSFVIGIPSIMAAAVLELKDALSQPAGVGIGTMPIIAGILSAMVVGFLAIKLLRWMVSTDKLGVFAVYTFALGAAVVIVGIIEHNTGVNIVTGMKL